MYTFHCPKCRNILKVGGITDAVFTCVKCKARFTYNEAMAAPPPEPKKDDDSADGDIALGDSVALGHVESPPRWVQRLGGCGMVLVCLGFTAWNWNMALTEGKYFQGAAVAFPAFAVLGIAIIFFRASWMQTQTDEGKKSPTPLGVFVLVIAFIAGGANLLFMWLG